MDIWGLEKCQEALPQKLSEGSANVVPHSLPHLHCPQSQKEALRPQLQLLGGQQGLELLQVRSWWWRVGQTHLVYFIDTPNSFQVSQLMKNLWNYRNHMRP